MIALALLLLLQSTPPAPSEEPDIVITGRLDAAQAELRQCIKQGCPPQRDIALSMAVAETQFSRGNVQEARDVLRFSRGRNKRYAKELPVQVSRLLALDAEVALVLALDSYGRIGRLDAVSAIRKGLPDSDARVGAQRLVSADTFAEQGRFRLASNLYDGIEKDARRYGWTTIRGAAMLRQVRLYALLASFRDVYQPEARARLAKLLADPDPKLKRFRDGAIILQVRMADLAGNKRALTKALAQAQDVRVEEALPLLAPTIKLDSNDMAPGVFNASTVAGQWVEYSYRIAPDGSVHDIALAGRSPRAEGRWIEKVGTKIAARRYAALDLPADAPGLRRLERYVLVPGYRDPPEAKAGTESTVRASNSTKFHVPKVPPQVTVLDMTPESDRFVTPRQG